jgi:hypothetical protein
MMLTILARKIYGRTGDTVWCAALDFLGAESDSTFLDLCPTDMHFKSVVLVIGVLYHDDFKLPVCLQTE